MNNIVAPNGYLVQFTTKIVYIPAAQAQAINDMDQLCHTVLHKNLQMDIVQETSQQELQKLTLRNIIIKKLNFVVFINRSNIMTIQSLSMTYYLILCNYS